MEQERDCERQKMQEGKGKSCVPTEMTQEWKRNESVITDYISYVCVIDQSNLFTQEKVFYQLCSNILKGDFTQITNKKTFSHLTLQIDFSFIYMDFEIPASCLVEWN